VGSKRQRPAEVQEQTETEVPKPVQDLVNGTVRLTGALQDHLEWLGNHLAKDLVQAAAGKADDLDLDRYDDHDLLEAAEVIHHHHHGEADHEEVEGGSGHLHAPHAVVEGGDERNPLLELLGLRRGPLSEQRSVELLQEAFGEYKTMSAGDVRMLDSDGIKAAWQEIYGGGPHDWELFVVGRGLKGLNGFAHQGVNYVNTDSANTGTVPHEMLHSNTAPDFYGVCGSPFTEGSTDYLKQHALRLAGLRSPNSYARQLEVVEAFLDTGVSEPTFFDCYLNGGAQRVVADWVDDKCVGDWDAVKEATEKSDWASAKAHLELEA